LSISFFAALSGWGYLTILLSSILGLFFAAFFTSKFKVFIFLLTLVIFFYFNNDGFVIKNILTMLPNDKLSEYEAKLSEGFINWKYLKGNYFGLADINHLSLADINHLNQINSYGAEIVLYRYGLFGFFVFGISCIYFLYLSINEVVDFHKSFPVRICNFVLIFGTLIISLKSPTIILGPSFLFFYYINYYNSLYFIKGKY